jgi:hypothetical protein
MSKFAALSLVIVTVARQLKIAQAVINNGEKKNHEIKKSKLVWMLLKTYLRNTTVTNAVAEKRKYMYIENYTK